MLLVPDAFVDWHYNWVMTGIIRNEGSFLLWTFWDKLWAIIFSADLIISWKVKWLCEYPVIGHWKLPMNGPTAHFWSFLSQALWHIFPFVHPRWTCSEAYLLLWPAWPAMTHSPSCLASGPGNCQPFRHDWRVKSKICGKKYEIKSQLSLSHYVKKISYFLSIVW